MLYQKNKEYSNLCYKLLWKMDKEKLFLKLDGDSINDQKRDKTQPSKCTVSFS